MDGHRHGPLHIQGLARASPHLRRARVWQDPQRTSVEENNKQKAWALGRDRILESLGTGLMCTYLNWYLALQGNIPARQILGTCWADYPFSRCRIATGRGRFVGSRARRRPQGDRWRTADHLRPRELKKASASALASRTSRPADIRATHGRRVPSAASLAWGGDPATRSSQKTARVQSEAAVRLSTACPRRQFGERAVSSQQFKARASRDRALARLDLKMPLNRSKLWSLGPSALKL